MSGNDKDGSIAVYGNDVEIVASEAAFSSAATASNKVSVCCESCITKCEVAVCWIISSQ